MHTLYHRLVLVSYGVSYWMWPRRHGCGQVWSSDFSRTLSDFRTQTHRRPRQLVWCAADSLLLLWDRLLLMVGPYGDTVKYETHSPHSPTSPTSADPAHATPLLLAEADGVRIIGRAATELLQRVAEETEAAFLPGSLAPPARLIEAHQAFEAGSVVVDDLLRSLSEV